MLIRNVKLVAGEERDWERYGSSQLRQSLRRRLYLTGFVTIDRQPGDADRFRKSDLRQPAALASERETAGIEHGKITGRERRSRCQGRRLRQARRRAICPSHLPGNNNSLSPTYDKTALDTFWPGQ